MAPGGTRERQEMMMWLKHIACPQLCHLDSGTVRSAALALMRMDVLEMRILYEEVIPDILFYFLSPLFHLVSIFVARSVSRRSPVSQTAWEAVCLDSPWMRFVTVVSSSLGVYHLPRPQISSSAKRILRQRLRYELVIKARLNYGAGLLGTRQRSRG